MIADSLRRAGVAASYWPLTLMALLVGVLFAMSGTQWWIETDENWVILPTLVALFASFSIFYLQSRRAGEPHNEEQGSFWSWLGWILLGLIPMLILILTHMAVTGFDQWFDKVEGTPVESFIFGVGIVLGTPMMVVSAGRAINLFGVSSWSVMAATLRNAKSILLTVTLLIALPEFSSDLLSQIVRSETLSMSADLGFAVIESILFFVNSLLTAGVYASIYRAVEYECVPMIAS